MCAMVLRREDNIVFTTGRRAEFGFLGVHIRRRITTPRRCGDPFKTGRRGL